MADNTPESVMPTDLVLNELDEFAAQWDELRQKDGEWACRRAKHRRKFRTPCEVWFFEDAGSTVRRHSALTRNLSEQGIGLITKCPVLEGVPIEIRIQVANRPPTHLAGIVVFCRYTQRSYHEVGVSLMAHQTKPIFADDPMTAVALLPWLQQALRNLKRASQTAKSQPTAPK